MTLSVLRRGYALLLVGWLLSSCHEKPAIVEKPAKKPLSPIERYVQEHFSKKNAFSGGSILPRARTRVWYWEVDSLPIKSIEATLYHLKNVTPNWECIDCDQYYVIRNNVSGAFFRFYKTAWGGNTTRHESEFLAQSSSLDRLEPVNGDLVGLEAFLNERSVLTDKGKLVGAVDTILQHSRHATQRILSTSQLDSCLHYPKAKRMWPLRRVLLTKLKQSSVLLYSDSLLPEAVDYYELVWTGYFHQVNLIHARLRGTELE